jgi:hypothetical protein
MLRSSRVYSGRRLGMYGCMRGSVIPMRHLPVPVTAGVVILPIAADDESDDTDTDGGAVVDQGNILPLVGVDDVAAVHPASVRSRKDIAPAVVLRASLYGHSESASEDRHDRIVFAGPGV